MCTQTLLSSQVWTHADVSQRLIEGVNLCLCRGDMWARRCAADCFICINCPICMWLTQAAFAYTVLTLQLPVCTWMPMTWDFLNVGSDFFPAPTQTNQSCFLKLAHRETLMLSGCCCRPLNCGLTLILLWNPHLCEISTTYQEALKLFYPVWLREETARKIKFSSKISICKFY